MLYSSAVQHKTINLLAQTFMITTHLFITFFMLTFLLGHRAHTLSTTYPKHVHDGLTAR